MADPDALLAAANSASEKVAALHIVFLAVCTYVLVIVFGTTDLDLLIGKGVKLPVVDVEVPIVGFYATAPYLLVLVHFNLLLSLQLLSRKLYAFDSAAGKSDGADGLYEQLSIFPYNHYLIGRPSRLMGGFLALVVTITMLLLPLAALLTLQARFLAYQSEAVTWAQRTATWLDVVLVVIFWPVIMDHRDSWRRYVAGVWLHARVHWLRWLWGVAGVLMACYLLMREVAPFAIRGSDILPLVPDRKAMLTWLTEHWLFKVFVGWLLVILFAIAFPRVRDWLGRRRDLASPGAQARLNSGVPGLLAILLLGLPLSLMLVVDGEKIDRPAAVGTRILASLRHLDLHEKVLMARPAQPETLADVLGDDPSRREAALRSIHRVDLQNRNLRRADFSHAVLPKADLRGAQLQGAHIFSAHLQGADLRNAQLQDTIFLEARLQGAKLSNTTLQRTKFVETWLDGADLSDATFQGTFLSKVLLQGADLQRAKLQGANLSGSIYMMGANLRDAHLEGADLERAHLEGANLERAHLEGANLRRAHLQGANLKAFLKGANLQYAVLYTQMIKLDEPIDARSLKWQPLSLEEIESLRESQSGSSWSSKKEQSRYDDAIRNAAVPGLKAPQMISCLLDKDTQVTCARSLSVEEFRTIAR